MGLRARDANISDTGLNCHFLPIINLIRETHYNCNGLPIQLLKLCQTLPGSLIISHSRHVYVSRVHLCFNDCLIHENTDTGQVTSLLLFTEIISWVSSEAKMNGQWLTAYSRETYSLFSRARPNNHGHSLFTKQFRLLGFGHSLVTQNQWSLGPSGQNITSTIILRD